MPVLGRAHKAVHPLHRPLDFHLFPLPSLVTVLCPSSALRQCVCHPGCWSFPFPSLIFHSGTFSNVSPQLSLRTHAGTSPGVQSLGSAVCASPLISTFPTPPALPQCSEPSSQPVYSAVENALLMILGKLLPSPFAEKSCKAATLQTHAWLSQTVSACTPAGQDTRYNQDCSRRSGISVQNWAGRLLLHSSFTVLLWCWCWWGTAHIVYQHISNGHV